MAKGGSVQSLPGAELHHLVLIDSLGGVDLAAKFPSSLFLVGKPGLQQGRDRDLSCSRNAPFALVPVDKRYHKELPTHCHRLLLPLSLSKADPSHKCWFSFRHSRTHISLPPCSFLLFRTQPPQWVELAKTGTHKELGPYNPDWFYVRCAATARHVYVRSPVGVGALTKIFAGGKKRRGVRPNVSTRGSGSVARNAIKQLEKMGLVQLHANGYVVECVFRVCVCV